MNDKIIDTYLDRYDHYIQQFSHASRPAWFDRKALGVKQAISNPDFIEDIEILMACEPKSIAAHYEYLRYYFSMNYNMHPEITESFIIYSMEKDMRALSPMRAIDATTIVDFKNKKAYQDSNDQNAKENFLRLQNKFNAELAPNIYLRLGRSTTKNDLIWFINKYWESEIKPKIDTKPGKEVRLTETKLRNSMIYSLHKRGHSTEKIKLKIEELFGSILDDAQVYRYIKEFKPKSDQFETIKVQQKKIKNVSSGHKHSLMFNQETRQFYFNDKLGQ